MAEIKKLPVGAIFKSALTYCCDHPLFFAAFLLGHLAPVVVGALFNADDTTMMACLYYYLFWCLFFRRLFNRKPYLLTRKLVITIVPFIKMCFMTSLFVGLLLILPLIVPFFGIGRQWATDYENYLYLYMENGRLIDFGTVLLLLLSAPFLFWRPIMAWIAAINGRSGSMRFAFARTVGSYWRFVALSLFFAAATIIAIALLFALSLPLRLIALPTSILAIYLGVVLAKVYDFFFLEID